MFKLLIFLSIVAYYRVSAYSSLRLGDIYNGGFDARLLKFNELLKSMKTFDTNDGLHSSSIQSQRTVEVKPLSSTHDTPQEQVIDVPPDETPFTIHFRTHSTPVVVQQTRTPEVEHTSSEDEPHRVTHEVMKPVIQEIHEIIQPYRRVVQQIQPVIEELHSIVAKGEPRDNRPVSSLRGSSQSNSLRNHSPQGTVSSSNGIPVYRSFYTGPAYTGKSAS